MRKTTVALILCAIFTSGCQTSDRREGQVVTTMPVLADMAPNETRLYDDGKCGAGQIARFHKRAKNAGLTRTCVESPRGS